MKGLLLQKANGMNFAFSIGLILLGVMGIVAQDSGARPSATPLMQPIVITKSPTGPVTSVPAPRPTPQGSGVKKTADVRPADIPMVPVIPTAGILVEKSGGQQVMENFSNYAFNPASNVKLITAFAVLKTYGPNYRYSTNVWTDGEIDSATGTLMGNLYVSGRDPAFNLEHGVAIAEALNKLGIRAVQGDLVVTSNFSMAFNNSPAKSGALLYNSMNISGRTAATTKAWQAHNINAGKVVTIPSVTISGKVYVDILPTNTRVLFSHDSAPLKDVLKVCLSYSNNFMSEKLGESVGGTEGVERLNQTHLGIAPEELQLASSSGLGFNRVTPRAMMRVLRGLRNELARHQLRFEDIMPVAGIDPGTLANRFKAFNQIGSVVAKTGTLGNTDGGVSTLTGETRCANGETLFFVIFNQKGAVKPYRNYQDLLVTTLQNNCGGAAQLGYQSLAFPTRMANTRISYPALRSRN